MQPVGSWIMLDSRQTQAGWSIASEPRRLCVTPRFPDLTGGLLCRLLWLKLASESTVTELHCNFFYYGHTHTCIVAYFWASILSPCCPSILVSDPPSPPLHDLPFLCLLWCYSSNCADTHLLDLLQPSIYTLLYTAHFDSCECVSLSHSFAH